MKSPLLVLWALSLFATAACADTFQSFNYEGTFRSSPNGAIDSVSGGITIDTTTGVVTDGTPFLISPPVGTPILRSLSEPPEVFTAPEFLQIGLDSITTYPDPSSYASVVLTLPVATLVGYTGSILCTEATYALCPDHVGSTILPNRIYSTGFITGSITPAAATPEPSTLALLATGVFALAGTVRRRSRP